MASAKQIAWRKKFARMSKAGKFKKKSAYMKKGMKYFDSQKYADGTPFGKSKKAKSSSKKPKTLKLNPHNPVVVEMEKLNKRYYIARKDTGDATVIRRSDEKEIFFIPNLHAFTDPIGIESSPQNNGQILFMLDSGGVVNLPT